MTTSDVQTLFGRHHNVIFFKPHPWMLGKKKAHYLLKTQCGYKQYCKWFVPLSLQTASVSCPCSPLLSPQSFWQPKKIADQGGVFLSCVSPAGMVVKGSSAASVSNTWPLPVLPAWHPVLNSSVSVMYSKVDCKCFASSHTANWAVGCGSVVDHLGVASLV